MLAPPQARRIGPGGAATRKEAVNTHSNARFGGEVEWNISGTTTFFSTAVCREVTPVQRAHQLKQSGSQGDAALLAQMRNTQLQSQAVR